MRGGLAVVVLAACGRVGFDDRSDGADVCVGVSVNDEDGDGLVDDCDPCPHVAGDATDGDGDGVGDACDPRGTPTEAIALFDPFLAASSAWDYLSARVEDGALVMEGMQVTSAKLLGLPQHSVYSLRADLAQTGTLQHQLSFQMREGVTARFFCELYVDPPDFYVSATYTLDGNQFTPAQRTIPGTFTDSDVVLEMVLEPPQFSCRLQWQGTTYTSPTSTIPGAIVADDIRIVMNGFAGGVRHFTRISME